MNPLNRFSVWVRGAGELGSAVAQLLHKTGFQVILSDLPHPLAIRRKVTFSDALLGGRAEVEGVRAIQSPLKPLSRLNSRRAIPILTDSPDLEGVLQPSVLVDARMLKVDPGDLRERAPLVIGLGPGFNATQNCQAVIETQRGHDLGRVIWQGPATPNTGIPGRVGGETLQRVIYAPAGGRVSWKVDFGDLVKEGQIIGHIDNQHEIRSALNGMVRGLIAEQVPISKGLKIADIDPRGKGVDPGRISDKARVVSGGVLEAILVHLNTNPEAFNHPREDC